MIETAGGQQEALPFTEDESEALAAKIVALDRVLFEHRDSKVKAVQELVAELNTILDGEEVQDADIPQS